MKNKRIIIILIIIIAAASPFYFYRINHVNNIFPASKTRVYEKNKYVSFNDDFLLDTAMTGYEIKVKDATILEYSDFLKKYYIKDEYSGMPQRIYDVEVVFKNVDASDNTGINLDEFYIQGVGVSNGIESNLCLRANPELDGNICFALKKNSEFKVHMPFMMYKEHYRDNVWNNIDDFDMNLVVTLYPDKKVIYLN